VASAPTPVQDDLVRPPVVPVPARVHRRRGAVLLVLAVFQFWLWGTRIVNLLDETGSFSAAFVAVHLVLYVAAIGAGVVLAVLGARLWREARAATDAASR
jgi:hypothetical protein